MELIDIYKAVFKAAGWEADETGFARIVGTNDHVMLKGRMIVLPLQSHLQNPDHARKWIFHPLSEYTVRGESEIIKRLKNSINTMLGARFNFLGKELLMLASDPMKQRGLTPEQLEVLTVIKEVDDKAISNWNDMFRYFIKETPDRGFLNIHLRRGGEYKGQTYPRVGLVVFPFYRDMSEDNFKHANMRKKDAETYRQLYRAIFPEIDVAEAYNYGYVGTVAPFFCTLMNTTYNVAARLNELVKMFEDRFTVDAETDLTWYKPLQDHEALTPMIRRIPMQEGNDGELIPLQTTSAHSTPPPAAPTAAYIQPAPTPAQNPAPHPYGAYGGYPPPGYPAPNTPPPQAQDVYMSDGGLSFKKLCQVNPAFGQGPNHLGHQLAAKEAYESWRAYTQSTQGQPAGYPPHGYGQPQPGYGGYPPPGYGQPPAGYNPPPAYYPPANSWRR